MLQGSNHVTDEPLRMHIGDACIRVVRANLVADSVHQMGFAQANTAINKQRVVGRAWVFGYLHGSGARQLVTLALHEAAECEFGIESAAE